jgi:hypothetical protein
MGRLPRRLGPATPAEGSLESDSFLASIAVLLANFEAFLACEVLIAARAFILMIPLSVLQRIPVA